MENRLELNLDDQKKTEEDVARLPIYGFIKKNFALWDALYRNEFRIHRLSDEIEKGSSLLGEIDRKEKMKEIDDLRCEEGAILDKLIKKLNKAKVAGGIPDSEDLYDAYDLADSVINSTERDVDADDDESDDDGDAADPLDDCQEEHIPDISQMLRRRMATKESARKLGSLKSKKEIKAILDDEHSRLEKVRKLLNQSPEKNSDPDAFDPQKDLLAISKKSAGDVLVEGGEKPSATKKEQLERFKNEMAFQAFGMGKINHFLENKLSQSDMVDLDALYFEFESKAKEYKLTDWQIERYRSVFTTFKEAIKKKDADVEKYKDMSNVEIVKQVSGYGCKGEVEMEANGSQVEWK